MNRIIVSNILIFLMFIVFVSIGSSCNRGEQKATVADIEVEADLAELNQRIEKDSTDHAAFSERAVYYLKHSTINKALGDINIALRLKPDHGPYLLILSDLYFAMGEAQRCRETIMKVLEKDDEDTDAMIKMAEFGLYYKDYTLVQRYADRALSVQPNLAQAHFILGFSAKEQGDTTLAMRQFRLATESDREFYDAFVQLGILYASQRDTLAAAYYKTALKLMPGSLEVLYNLGLHYQETGSYNEAFEVYNRILSIEPGFKQAYYNIGYIHLVYLGVYDVAAGYFDKAIQIDPEYFEAYYNRGYSLEMAGDVTNARRDYEKALQLKPNYPLAVDGLNRLDRGDRLMKDEGL